MGNISFDSYINLISLIVNNVVIIALAIFAYFYIDKKNVKRLKNQEEVARVLLLSVYKNCKANVDLLDNQNAEKTIIKHTDFSKPINDNDPIKILERSAFENESEIVELFKNGAIEGDYLQSYMDMKSAYKLYMSMRIAFFDAPELYLPIRIDFDNKYRDGISKLEGFV